jgi:hypothetical protein
MMRAYARVSSASLQPQLYIYHACLLNNRGGLPQVLLSYTLDLLTCSCRNYPFDTSQQGGSSNALGPQKHSKCTVMFMVLLSTMLHNSSLAG